MIGLLRRRPDLVPSLAIATAAVLWGLFWIPVRAIEDAGVGSAWAGTLVFASGGVAFVPLALCRWRRFCRIGKDDLGAAALAGLAFALYAISLNLTEVVRALLLFYMTPLWSTLLGIALLGERLTVNRVLALAFALAGLVVVLDAGVGLPWPRQIGDWFALGSGVCWSFASVKLFQGGSRHMFEKIFLFLLFSFGASLVLAWLPLGADGGVPNLTVVAEVWPWIVLLALMVVPVAFLTIWPAALLSPGRVGMLLMGDIVVGVASAAWLTDEPFGVREIMGTVLIVGAAAVEVTRQQTLVR